MLDNLRDDASGSPFFDDDDELPDFLDEDEQEAEAPKQQSDPFAFLKPIMILTPVQRFILSTLLFMTVCIIGVMALLVTGKFVVF